MLSPLLSVGTDELTDWGMTVVVARTTAKA